MIIFIDTAHPEVLTVGLAADGGEIIELQQTQAQKRQDETVLSEITSLLQAHDGTLADVKGIVVVSGPGPFTALRVGVVTANALGYALQVPVAPVHADSEHAKAFAVGIAMLTKLSTFKPVEAEYGAPPRITLKKR